MKVLLIGGTGIISTAISRLALDMGWELFLLNRGNRNNAVDSRDKPGKLTEIRCDIRADSEDSIRAKLTAALSQTQGAARFDAVADFIAFTRENVEKDYRIFNGLCNQYIFVSSASAYQKPPSSHAVNEGTPLANPYWEYSRNKIACEEYLMSQYRENRFPITIVRPSHTYDERSVPLGVHGNNGSWQVIRRILDGKPVIIHGDGTSLWTLTHAGDFAQGFAGLVGNVQAIGEAVHITSDESLTWNQIYGIIAKALDRPLKAVHISSEFLAQCSPLDYTGSLIGDKANSVVFDNSKIKRMVPYFCAKTRFDQGIRDTLKYILLHPEYQQEDSDFDAWCDLVIKITDLALQEIKG